MSKMASVVVCISGLLLGARHPDVRDSLYRCTEPIALVSGQSNLMAGHFEQAFSWSTLRSEYVPADLFISVRESFYSEAEIRGGGAISNWRLGLKSESLQSVRAEFLKFMLKSVKSKGGKYFLDYELSSIRKASKDFQIFSSPQSASYLIEGKRLPLIWKDLLSDFRAFVRVRTPYAVILSSELHSVSICLPFKEDQIENEFLSGLEVRGAAFDFFSGVNHLDLFACQGFLTSSVE